MLGVKRDQEPEQPDRRWIGPAPWIETPPPGPQAKLLIQRRSQLTCAQCRVEQGLVIKRGFGSVVEDVDGNRYLDFAAGCAIGPTGHAHPKVVAAIQAQAHDLVHSCGGSYCSPNVVEFMDRLTRIFPGGVPSRVLLTRGRRELFLAAQTLALGKTKRSRVVVLSDEPEECGGAFAGGGQIRQEPPSPHQGLGDSPVEVIPHETLAAFESRLLHRSSGGPQEVAAVFVEPAQVLWAVGDDASTYLGGIRRLCDEHGILLVCNETRTALGRTGKWFGCEHFGIAPDMIVISYGLAGGLPLAAVVGAEGAMYSHIGMPCAGGGPNPVCCAAALATLDAVEGGYMEGAIKLGELLLEGLQEIGEKRKVIRNARSLGATCGVDVVSRRTGKLDERRSKRILDACFERGLILPLGSPGHIRFYPPLCINETQLDVGLRIFDESVATVL